MNTINFNQAEGFPLDTQVLDALQTAYSVFNALGLIAGDKTIISGVSEITVDEYADGYVCIDGEVLEFRGGSPLPNVKVFQNVIQKEFEDGQLRDVITERWVSFGSGTGSFPFSELDRIKPIKNLQKSIVPIGLVALWPSDQAANIPEGWTALAPLDITYTEYIHIKYTG